MEYEVIDNFLEPENFKYKCEEALYFTANNEALVTLGIKPTHVFRERSTSKQFFKSLFLCRKKIKRRGKNNKIKTLINTSKKRLDRKCSGRLSLLMLIL